VVAASTGIQHMGNTREQHNMRTIALITITLAIGYVMALDGDIQTRLAILQQDTSQAATRIMDLIQVLMAEDREQLVGSL
jgi:hypothetical protein